MAETIIHKSKTKKDTQGNLVTETSETRIKNREKKDKFMLLYVEAYSHLANLPKVANSILAEILQSMVTGDNTIRLDSASRVEIMQNLGVTNAQISTALKQLCEQNIIQKVMLNKRTFKYVLNPYIFGSGSWADIRQQRIRFDYILDKTSKDSRIEAKVTTKYEDGTSDEKDLNTSVFNDLK